ncbi:HAMP domain-containing sensor histidine kinase [Paenibacillus sp. HB172176]|uniref:sensor histidine kinase n=1 Tax=Paenibacillus sp. HB172176 TaxID=2493690 RepID=UPI00143C4946|nr:HAMP domain-containing sensor histidine kinase [Paenibacillus sp. HB172176]
MKPTVRQKIFLFMGLLVFLTGSAYSFGNRVSLEALFDQFREEEMSTAFAEASPADQIELLKTYVIGHMKLLWLAKWGIFIAVGLFFSLWVSGILTRPLRKLIAAIERVTGGDLEVSVPVQSNDEYGKVIQTFNDMTQRLREAEDARKKLMADFAHEFRTPLSIMQLKLENYQQAGHHVPPEMLRIHDEVIRLSLLVNDLQTLSLAEAGKLSLDRKPLDLSAHLEQIIDDVKYEAEENGIEFRLSTTARPVFVSVDARRMTQVFINLLTNAIRYTPQGGKISVVIEDEVAEQHAVYTCVSVVDTGIGIPAEELERLFDRFYRVEKARPHTGGTGLGLSITHQFVKAHGGFIRVMSELGQGTTFTVYLPVNKDNAPA